MAKSSENGNFNLGFILVSLFFGATLLAGVYTYAANKTNCRMTTAGPVCTEK